MVDSLEHKYYDYNLDTYSWSKEMTGKARIKTNIKFMVKVIFNSYSLTHVTSIAFPSKRRNVIQSDADVASLFPGTYFWNYFLYTYRRHKQRRLIYLCFQDTV
jgi:hypothetical protein